MISARNRKYLSPMGRGGSVDQGSPSPTNDPVKKLLRKLKQEKLARQAVQNARRLNLMREMDAKSEEQAQKFEEIKRKIQEDKMQRL